ncbi:MAG: Ldh family oxidoreductase [Pseudomonadota bacterium]
MVADDDIVVPHDRLEALAIRVLGAMGTPDNVAREVAGHLVEADLMGVPSHGCMRLAQYPDWAEQGLFDPSGQSATYTAAGGRTLIDGGDGFGIPSMRLAVDTAIEEARAGSGMSAVGITNTGHTGRIGAFAERAAAAGFFAVIFGGGSGREWPQVVPFGGAEGRLPTNPYALGIPGGDRGPVVLDFATSAGAGGKVYAASYSGRALTEGLCVDVNGRPTTDPADYVAGGALLPMAGPKGFGLAVIAEMMGRALLGDVRSGLSWLVLVIDVEGFSTLDIYRREAEDLLDEIRTCPPAPGFERVEIPGEREREIAEERRSTGIPIPRATLEAVRDRARSLGLSDADLTGI